MATITAFIKNTTSNNYVVHVFDHFGGVIKEITNPDPFYLGKDETSPSFLVNVGSAGDKGKISYQVVGGPSIGHIDVRDGETVEID